MFILVENLETNEIRILSDEDIAYQKSEEIPETKKQKKSLITIKSPEWINALKKFILKKGNIVTPFWIAHFNHIFKEDLKEILTKGLLSLEKSN